MRFDNNASGWWFAYQVQQAVLEANAHAILSECADEKDPRMAAIDTSSIGEAALKHS